MNRKYSNQLIIKKNQIRSHTNSNSPQKKFIAEIFNRRLIKNRTSPSANLFLFDLSF